MNPNPHEDQTYGSGRNLDRQPGRLYGQMSHQPIFPGPTTAEFWMIALVSMGLTLLALTALSLLGGYVGLSLLLAGIAIGLLTFLCSYMATALHNWRKRNYRYQMPR